MNIEIIDKFKFLPHEIINQIVNYTNVLVYRHGKYINRISDNDERYNILKTIPKPIKINPNRFLLKLLNIKDAKIHGYFLEYIIGMYIKINIKCVEYKICEFDRHIEIKSFFQYINDSNNKWSRTIEYSM